MINYQVIIVMAGENSSGYYCQENFQRRSLVLLPLCLFPLVLVFISCHLNIGIVPTMDMLTLATVRHFQCGNEIEKCGQERDQITYYLLEFFLVHLTFFF